MVLISVSCSQFQYVLLFSRQGKVRLQKWYHAYTQKEKKKIQRELVAAILARRSKMCNFLEYRETKIVYKRFGLSPHTMLCSEFFKPLPHRYASLYFCVAIEPEDNELISLEIIHRYVELLDKYFGSVS